MSRSRKVKAIVIDEHSSEMIPEHEVEQFTSAGLNIAEFEKQYVKLGFKITKAIQKSMKKLNFSKEIVLKFTSKSKKVNDQAAALLMALALTPPLNQPKTLSLRLDIRTDLPNLNLPPAIEGYLNGINQLEELEISEQLSSLPQGKPLPKSSFAKEFFQAVSKNSKHVLKKLKIVSNNDYTTVEILEGLHEYRLQGLSVSMTEDKARFNDAMKGLHLEGLVELKLGNSTVKEPTPYITEFMKTIELMTNLERLYIAYPCAGMEQTVVDSITKLENLQELVFENPLVLTEEQVLTIYERNVFLCLLQVKNKESFGKLSAKTRGIIHLFTVRKFNYNKLASLIMKFEDSPQRDLRFEHLMNLSEYFRTVVI